MTWKENKRIRDKSPMIRVVLFASVLIVFVALLSVMKWFFFAGVQRDISGRMTEAQGGASIVKQGIGIDTKEFLSDEIIQDLPKDAVVEIRFGEDYFSVSRDSINPGRPKNPDLSISLPANYASQLSDGLCEVTKKANSNGELIIEARAPQAVLLWKYKGMLKHKECLG